MKSGAERQAALRARRRNEYAHRLNLWLPEDAGRALQRLARHYGVSQGDMIARLVINADRGLSDSLDEDDLGAYYVTQ